MAQSFRMKFMEFLSDSSSDRDELLSRFEDDERRAFMYHFCYLPLADRTDPNHPPAPPFSEKDMKRLRKSADEKFLAWMVERILADRPFSPLESN